MHLQSSKLNLDNRCRIIAPWHRRRGVAGQNTLPTKAALSRRVGWCAAHQAAKLTAEIALQADSVPLAGMDFTRVSDEDV